MSAGRVYRMRDVERLTGVPRSTIHYYIREGLLPPPRRRGKTVADYGAEHVRTLRYIRRLQEELRLSLGEIRRVLVRGQPRVDPTDLDRSLEMLVHYAEAQAQGPASVQGRVEEVLRGAVERFADLDASTAEPLRRRVERWLAEEREHQEIAVGREIDLIFRSVLETGRLDAINLFHGSVVRLAEAGRRALGRVMRPRLVEDLLQDLRVMLSQSSSCPALLSPEEQQAAGVDRLLGALDDGGEGPRDLHDIMWRCRLLAWHGRPEGEIPPPAPPSATGREPTDPLGEASEVQRLELQALEAWRRWPLGSGVQPDRDPSGSDRPEREDRGPDPCAGDDPLAASLAGVITARRELSVALRGLRSAAARPEHFRGLLHALELLESIPDLPLLPDPHDPRIWPTLLVEVHVAAVLGMLPPPLRFHARAGVVARRLRERLDHLPPEHPACAGAVDRVVLRNLGSPLAAPSAR